MKLFFRSMFWQNNLFISLGDMTTDSTLTKLMHHLGQNFVSNKVNIKLHQSF